MSRGKPVANKYQQGYFAGIRYARAKFVDEGKQEKTRVRWACAFWVVVAVFITSLVK